MSEETISDRVHSHFHSVALPAHDMHHLMRHILDCLGALKVRLEEDVEVAPSMLKTFSESCKLILDHVTDFEPIDNESAIKYLVEAFPDEKKRQDGRSWLPVHFAAAVHSTEPEVMKGMIIERPLQLLKGHLHCDIVATEDTPLHESYKGMLPIHLIVSLRHPNFTNVQLLVRKAPESLSLPDNRGWLPLHWCAFNNRSMEVMQYLLHSYSDAVFEVNKKGKLPFQLAAFNQYTIMMDLLLAENPEAIDGMDYNGNTPLHDAAKSLNHEAAKKLLALKPDLNRTRNFKEDLAIHRVFSFISKDSHRLQHRQFETIKAILNFNPEVAALPDRNDSLPLHLAVFHHCTYEIVEYIYNIYPSAALVKDNHGKVPIQYVNNAEVKKLLLKSSPPLVRAGITDTFSRFAS